jgi:hypothetical protein
VGTFRSNLYRLTHTKRLSVFGSVLILNEVVASFTRAFLYYTYTGWAYAYMLRTQEIFNAIDNVAYFALLVVPVFTYIAILRYNLYDIDLELAPIGHGRRSGLPSQR